MEQAGLGSRLKNFVYKINNLPSPPNVARNVISLTQNPEIPASNIAQAISRDQAISARVLKMVNSPFFGVSKEITTINHAVVVLGLEKIKNIVITTAIFDIFFSGKKLKHFDREEFWVHSLACGVASKLIAEHMKLKNLEDAFMCGLTHDMGKLILDKYFNREFIKIVSLVDKEDILIREAEQQILGIDHTVVGSVVAEHWNFPDKLIEAMRFHHNPDLARESQNIILISIVHCADILCRALGIGNGGDNKIPSMNEESWDLLNISKEKFKGLFSKIKLAIEPGMKLLKF